MTSPTITLTTEALAELVRMAWAEGINTGIGIGHPLHRRTQWDEWEGSEASAVLLQLTGEAAELAPRIRELEAALTDAVAEIHTLVQKLAEQDTDDFDEECVS